MRKVVLSVALALTVLAPAWGAGGNTRVARPAGRTTGGVTTVPLLNVTMPLTPTLTVGPVAPQISDFRAALLTGSALPAVFRAPADAPQNVLAPPVSVLPADAPFSAPAAAPVVSPVDAPFGPDGRPRLITTLASPLPEAEAGAGAESAAASEADFMARAQLGGQADGMGATAVAAPHALARCRRDARLSPAGRTRLAAAALGRGAGRAAPAGRRPAGRRRNAPPTNGWLGAAARPSWPPRWTEADADGHARAAS